MLLLLSAISLFAKFVPRFVNILLKVLFIFNPRHIFTEIYLSNINILLTKLLKKNIYQQINHALKQCALYKKEN